MVTRKLFRVSLILDETQSIWDPNGKKNYKDMEKWTQIPGPESAPSLSILFRIAKGFGSRKWTTVGGPDAIGEEV